jgi:ribonuclease HI
MLRDNGSLFGDPPGGAGASGDWVTAYCDGGSRGNPGPAGYGVFLAGPDGQKLAELSEFLGRTTNNVAEYRALLGALDWALQNGRSRLRVVADSELLVKQIKGQYKVASPDLRPLYEEAKRRIARLDLFRIEHVLRGKNREADRLANLAMDQGMGRSGGAGHPGESSRPASGVPASAQSTRPASPAPSAKGYVKGGVVHLIEGELPDGAFVRVTLDRR